MAQIKITVFLFTLVLMSACGYHLRGSIDLPEALKAVYVQGGSGQLVTSLKKILRASDGQLVDNRSQAGVVVSVLKEKMDRRVLSLSNTGRANEFELNYILDFVFLDEEGKEISTPQNITINRDYFNDQVDVLGKDNEELLIREEMYRQAVQSLFRRARVALEKHPDNVL